MELDLQQVSIRPTLRRASILVNHKDPGVLLEEPEIEIRDAQIRTRGKPALKLPGSYMRTDAHRWKRSPTLQLDPSTQGDGTWARYNRMAAMGSPQSLDVPDLADTVGSRPCEQA